MRSRLEHALPLAAGFVLATGIWLPLWTVWLGLSARSAAAASLGILWPVVLMFLLGATAAFRGVGKWAGAWVVGAGVLAGGSWLVAWRLSVRLVEPLRDAGGHWEHLTHLGGVLGPQWLYPALLGLLAARATTRRPGA
jgi:hypothetical protein